MLQIIPLASVEIFIRVIILHNRSFSLTDFIGNPTAVTYGHDLRAIQNKLLFKCLLL